MPARKPRDPNEKPQRERFIEAAREHGASEDPEEFERIFRQVVKPPRSRSVPRTVLSCPFYGVPPICALIYAILWNTS
jgi:hypothetical protein